MGRALGRYLRRLFSPVKQRQSDRQAEERWRNCLLTDGRAGVTRRAWLWAVEAADDDEALSRSGPAPSIEIGADRPPPRPILGCRNSDEQAGGEQP
jgi:hypothetical protein